MEWNHECVSKSERKCWAFEFEFLEAWAILHKVLKQGCCRHLLLSHRLIQNKQKDNCEAAEMMARKVHICIKDWEFHLMTPPKCQKLPSSILKTAPVKFQATSGSLSTTLWWCYRGSKLGPCHDKASLPYKARGAPRCWRVEKRCSNIGMGTIMMLKTL